MLLTTCIASGSYVDLKMPVNKNLTSGAGLQSDAVFATIKDRIDADPAKAKSINAVFAYKITKNGEVAKTWSKFSIKYLTVVYWLQCVSSVSALDLKNAAVIEGIAKDIKVDTTLTVADADMVEIALGKLNPQMAFMKGKLKITGNIMLTQKLVPLLKSEAKL